MPMVRNMTHLLAWGSCTPGFINLTTQGSQAWRGVSDGRHQWEHNILEEDGSTLPGLEVVAVVEKVAHLSIHRVPKQMCQ